MPKKWVVNASPIIVLARINKVSLFSQDRKAQIWQSYNLGQVDEKEGGAFRQ
jgi:hypothetical protein